MLEYYGGTVFSFLELAHMDAVSLKNLGLKQPWLTLIFMFSTCSQIFCYHVSLANLGGGLG